MLSLVKKEIRLLTTKNTKHEEQHRVKESKGEHQNVFVNNGGQEEHGHSRNLTVLENLKINKEVSFVIGLHFC